MLARASASERRKSQKANTLETRRRDNHGRKAKGKTPSGQKILAELLPQSGVDYRSRLPIVKMGEQALIGHGGSKEKERHIDDKPDE